MPRSRRGSQDTVAVFTACPPPRLIICDYAVSGAKVSILVSLHDKFVRSDERWFGVYRCHSARCAVLIVFQQMAHLLLRNMSLVIVYVNSIGK